MASDPPSTITHEPSTPTAAQAAAVWLRIGLLSFGGPAGQIALMHRELVDRRRWISEERFLHALNYCMLLPGPEAQQLATYLGWLMHRTVGGLVAGLLFILPGALAVLGLSILYVSFQHTASMQALLYGLKAAVLALVLVAVVRIGRRVLRNGAMVAIAVAAFAALVFGAPFPLVVLGAAVVGMIGGRVAPARFNVIGGHASPSATAGPAPLIDAQLDAGDALRPAPTIAGTVRTVLVWLAIWLLPLAALAAIAGPGHLLVKLGVFFSGLAVVTFGGAYAALASVAQQSAAGQGWIGPGEMLDGLGLAESTPGPLILVLQFVGFIAAWRDAGAGAGGPGPILVGCLGAAVVLWATFAPCFLFIFAGAPWIERLRGNLRLSAALSAITAAVVGVILSLALWFGVHVLFSRTTAWGTVAVPDWSSVDPVAGVITAAALVAMLRFDLALPWTLAGGALIGAAWHVLAR